MLLFQKINTLKKSEVKNDLYQKLCFPKDEFNI